MSIPLSSDGSFSVALPVGGYMLSIIPCVFYGCSSGPPTRFLINSGDTTTITVEAATTFTASYLEPDPLEILVNALTGGGFSVVEGDQAEFLLSVPTTHLRVNDGDVFAYVFESFEARLDETTRIAQSGESIGRRQLLWPQPPSFFGMGRLIVFTLSGDQDLLETLDDLFGPRFAGGEIPGFDIVPVVPDLAETAARSALAQRLGVSADSLMLVQYTPVEFSDASLGCPEEGTAYAQVTVDGYALFYDSDGIRHSYHVSADGRIGTDCLP